jgi:hypothetical protein
MLRTVAGLWGSGTDSVDRFVGPSHLCKQCNQGHRRHDSVVSVRVVHTMHEAILLISAGRGFEPHPPHLPRVAACQLRLVK